MEVNNYSGRVEQDNERAQLCHIQIEVLGIERGTHVPRLHILGIVFLWLMLENYFGVIPGYKTVVMPESSELKSWKNPSCYRLECNSLCLRAHSN